MSDSVEANESEKTEDQTEKKKSGGGFKRGLFKTVGMLFYIAFLLAVLVGALAAVEYYAYLQIKNSPLGAPYKDRDLSDARRSSVTPRPIFGYEPTAGFAATHNTKLGNSFEFINEQNFKDFDEVPLEKPKDEYRVFVTGGSVIYGRGPVPPTDEITDYYEVTFRWNIPHIMEKLLNADPRVKEKIGGKTVRVINAGVAGFVIQNDLMRYLGKLRLYKPDLIVSLDGANEVHTVARPLKDWNYFTEGQYQDVVNKVLDMSPDGVMSYLYLWLKRNTYFFTWLALRQGHGTGVLNENVGFTSHPQDPTPEMIEMRRRNIDQVADVEAIYHKVLETDGVPHVFALQPMLRNCRKKRNPIEEQVELMTGMVKISFYDAKKTYDLLVKRIKERGKEAGIDIMDMTDIFKNVKSWVWTDWCHVTNGANYLMAKELTNRVKTDVFKLPLLPDDPLKEPYDSYFVDYAKDARVLVNGKPINKGLHILKGYPGKDKVTIPANEAKASPGVTLDLGEIVPISRLRIVWGSEASTPKAWKMQISDDGKDWKDWLTVDDTKPDPFDQWPGFEYYSDKEAKGRYVRYVQTGANADKEIVLRQISLFR